MFKGGLDQLYDLKSIVYCLSINALEELSFLFSTYDVYLLMYYLLMYLLYK